MTYRPDIDGLRAVAVLLVVFFHAGFPYLSGGFIGVDVFFVISGYLITSIIVSEVKQEKFSYINFYERRARRILPAMYVMSFIVLLATLFFQMPDDLEKTAKTLFFATLFSANIFFWRTTDYFSGDSDFEFFLHAWSLAVEEQFYFIFPIVILLFFNRGKWLLLLTVFAFVASFLISVYTSYHHVWASYYLLPSRAWQMMAGALLAIVSFQGLKLGSKQAGLLGILAFLCILLPAVFYSKQTRFPGLAALLPTLGAAGLIFVGGIHHQNWISKLLSLSWIKFVGLISYSLYLWHWPVFAFLRNYEANVKLSVGMSVLGIVCSFLFAFASWKFVEAPFRDKKRFSLRKIFSIVGFSSLALLISCVSIVLLKGIPSRIDPQIIELSQVSESEVIDNPCVQKTAADIKNKNICRVGNDSSVATIALWGDSHLGALKKEFSLLLNDAELSGVFLGKTGCPPIEGVLKRNLADGQACLGFNEEVLSFLVGNSQISTVVLHARWALSVEGTRYGAESGPNYELVDTLSSKPSTNNANVVDVALNRTISQLLAAGKKVVLIAGVPEVGVSVPRVMENNLFWGKKRDIRPSFDNFSVRQASTNRILQTISERFPEVQLIYPSSVLCDDEYCAIALNGHPLYFDDDHLSDLGAKLLLKSVRSLLVSNSGY